MTDTHEIHTCPWCEGESWELKTTYTGEGPRLYCDGCNAGFLLGDLPEALSDDRRKMVEA